MVVAVIVVVVVVVVVVVGRVVRSLVLPRFMEPWVVQRLLGRHSLGGRERQEATDKVSSDVAHGGVVVRHCVLASFDTLIDCFVIDTDERKPPKETETRRARQRHKTQRERERAQEKEREVSIPRRHVGKFKPLSSIDRSVAMREKRREQLA